MSKAKVERASAWTEFFSNIPAETRREILMGIVSEARASQRDLVQKAKAIKTSLDSTSTA